MSSEYADLFDHGLLHFFFFSVQLIVSITIGLSAIVDSALLESLYTTFLLFLIVLQIVVTIWYIREDASNNYPLLAFAASVIFIVTGIFQVFVPFTFPLFITLLIVNLSFLGSYPMFMLLSHPNASSIYRGLLYLSLGIIAVIPILDLTIYRPAISIDDGVITVLDQGTVNFFIVMIAFLYSLYSLFLGSSFLYYLFQERLHPRKRKEKITRLK